MKKIGFHEKNPALAQPDDLEAVVRYYERQADAAAGYFVRSDAEISLARRELKQRSQAFTILSQLQETITLDEHEEMDTVFEATLARIHEILKIDRSVVFLKMRDKQGLFQVSNHLGLDDQVAKRLSVLFFKFTEAEREGKEYLLVNRKIPSTPFIELLRDTLGIRYFACLPLMIDHDVFGYLLSSRDKEAYPFYQPFNKAQYTTFSAITGFLSASYVNFTLYNDLRDAKASLEKYNSALEGKIREATRDIRQQNCQLEQEKERSEELLLNLLPRETADELRRTGQALPRNFDNVSVIFSDIVGFSEIAENLNAGELVAELDTIFRAFDHIVAKNGLEKLKTIGDCYMCAGGIPVPDETNAIRAVRACIAFNRYLAERKDELSREGRSFFEMRCGVHSGPVIAGVVGSRKFAYDIWGHTVNVAARIEAAGERGKVNISETTFQLVNKHFLCTHRGPVTVKHGIPIEMYFVDSALESNSGRNVTLAKSQ